MLHSRRFLAHKVNEANKILLESNPYLTLHLEDFASEFDSKIVIVYRDPKKVIESHYNKGWYQDFTPVLKKGYSAPGFQYTHEKAHYSFGRLFPNNELELSQWIKLSVVGKIAWYWKTIYSKIIEQVKNLEHVCLIRCRSI